MISPALKLSQSCWRLRMPVYSEGLRRHNASIKSGAQLSGLFNASRAASSGGDKSFEVKVEGIRSKTASPLKVDKQTVRISSKISIATNQSINQSIDHSLMWLFRSNQINQSINQPVTQGTIGCFQIHPSKAPYRFFDYSQQLLGHHWVIPKNEADYHLPTENVFCYFFSSDWSLANEQCRHPEQHGKHLPVNIFFSTHNLSQIVAYSY